MFVFRFPFYLYSTFISHSFHSGSYSKEYYERNKSEREVMSIGMAKWLNRMQSLTLIIQIKSKTENSLMPKRF